MPTWFRAQGGRVGYAELDLLGRRRFPKVHERIRACDALASSAYHGTELFTDPVADYRQANGSRCKSFHFP